MAWTSGLRVDALEISVWGLLRPEITVALNKVREAARAEREQGGRRKHRAAVEIGGKRFGFVGLGSMGEVIVTNRVCKLAFVKTVKACDVEEGMNSEGVRLVFSAWALQSRGYRKLGDDWIAWFHALCSLKGPARVSRLDVCVDLVSDAPCPEWYFNGVGRGDRQVWIEHEEDGKGWIEHGAGDRVKIRSAGDRFTALTVGRRGGPCYVRIYDKGWDTRKDVAKRWWWPVWVNEGLDLRKVEKPFSVWRVEAEVRTERLAKFRMREWHDCKRENAPEDLWGWVTCRPYSRRIAVQRRGKPHRTDLLKNTEGFFRIVDPTSATRKRRAKVVPFWMRLWAVCEGRAIPVRPAALAKADTLYTQALGTLLTAAAADGVDANVMFRRLREVAAARGGAKYLASEIDKRATRAADANEEEWHYDTETGEILGATTEYGQSVEALETAQDVLRRSAELNGAVPLFGRTHVDGREVQPRDANAGLPCGAESGGPQEEQNRLRGFCYTCGWGVSCGCREGRSDRGP